MNTISVISFDLDGTLVDNTYTTWIWEEGIPELYAKKYGVSIEEATTRILAEYARVGDESLTWYDIGYWFSFFALPDSWQKLLAEHREKIRLFPESLEVLKQLGQRYDLIVTSNAAREFVDMEVYETGIAPYFSRIISATSDFGHVKKDPEFYRKLCATLGADPSRLIHVGDHYEHDYLAPRRVGITSYYLNRTERGRGGTHTIGNLLEFVQILDA